MPRVLLAILQVLVRNLETVAEPAFQRALKCGATVVFEQPIGLARTMQRVPDLGFGEPAARRHGAEPKGRLVEALVPLTFPGDGELDLDFLQRLLGIGAAALIGSLSSRMILTRRLGRPLQNALDPPQLSGLCDRRPLGNAVPAATVRQHRAGTDHESTDASHVASGRKTAAAIAERLARRLTEIEVEAIVRRLHHRHAGRQRAMALDKSLEGAHAIAAVGVPVEIDYQ